MCLTFVILFFFLVGKGRGHKVNDYYEVSPNDKKKTAYGELTFCSFGSGWLQL